MPLWDQKNHRVQVGGCLKLFAVLSSLLSLIKSAWLDLLAAGLDYLGLLQGIENVPKMAEGINPATWMLEISTISMEEKVGVDYATAFVHSDLYRWALEIPPSPSAQPSP